MQPTDVSGYLADNLPTMLKQLIGLAEINSGTFNLKGIKQATEVLQELFACLNCEHTIMPVKPMQVINDQGENIEIPLGSVLRLWKRPEAPIQVLLVGHIDTVFPEHHTFQKTRMIDADRLGGPGVADMKGGLIVLLWALKAFEQLPQAQNLGWELLINADEEIGSPGSAEILESAAKKHCVGFVFEPTIDVKGSLAGACKGCSKHTLVMRGKAAHAGRNFADGRNAICKMAEVIGTIHALNGQRDGVTVNVGYVHGGEAVNIVPDCCICRIDVRVPNNVDQDWIENNLHSIVQNLNNESDDFELKLHSRLSRKPKEMDSETERLYKIAQQVGAQQGLEITWRATGGVTDGNTLAAQGLPNIDTLGVRGEHIHTADEYMVIPSLLERSQLFTNILINLCENGFK